MLEAKQVRFSLMVKSLGGLSWRPGQHGREPHLDHYNQYAALVAY
jgi:hypothetical protein